MMRKLFLALALWLAAGGAQAAYYHSFLGMDDYYWFDLTGSWVVSDVTTKVLPEDLKPLGPCAVFAGDAIYEGLKNPTPNDIGLDLALDAAGCGLSYIINIKW